MMVRPGIRDFFRLRPRTRQAIDAQVDEEIRLHLELRAEELIARGVEPGVADAEARLRFGAVDRDRLILQRMAERRERSMTMREWLAGWRQDFGYSVRALSREPLLALMVVLTLGLGIGANATMFGIVDRLLLRGPAHVVNPDELRRVYVTQQHWDGRSTRAITGYVTYTLLRERTGPFEAAAAYRLSDARMGRGPDARELPVGWSTWDMFALLGVDPALGRFYTEEEDRPNQARRVAVLDYGYWQSSFGGARDALGSTITVNDGQYTIIGVAPEGFTGPELRPTMVWLPMSTGYEPRPDWPTTWRARWLNVLVRLNPEVTIERAAAEATAVYRGAAAEANMSDAAEASLSLLPTRYGGAGTEAPEVALTRWLIGVSAIVLLVACANVVNLLLARGVRRRRELAVRLALGVSRARLVRLLLSESLLLAFAGGLIAAAIAYWGGQLLRAALLPDVQWTPPLNGRVLLFSAGVVVLTGILTGLAPALRAGRQDLTATLKQDTLQAGARRSRLRGTLTVLQTAFSLVLLVGAGLFVRSLLNVQQLDLGIDSDRVLAVWSDFPSTADLPEAQQSAARVRRAAFYELAIERLRADPRIESAALAIGTPLRTTFGVDLEVPGIDSIPELPGGGPYITAAGPGYFETVGTRIVRGRGIEAGEGEGSEAVVVVNETMARTLWPGEDALNRCVIIGGDDAPCARVVGIAEDAKRRTLTDEPAMQYYIPWGQERRIGGTQIVVRPRGDAAAYIPELHRQLHALAPTANYFSIDLLRSTLEAEIRPWRLGATMFLVFGGLALLIAAVGLYSVIAYAVARRRIEMGVRLALGARAVTIAGMVLRQAMAPVLLGMVIGIPLALAGGHFLERLLFQVSSRDVTTFATVCGLLAVVAVAACLIPAFRAGRTNPIDALRVE